MRIIGILEEEEREKVTAYSLNLEQIGNLIISIQGTLY